MINKRAKKSIDIMIRQNNLLEICLKFFEICIIRLMMIIVIFVERHDEFLIEVSEISRRQNRIGLLFTAG
jgi:hypothetical protein